MAGIDWLKIKNEYIYTETSYRKLAEKHGVSLRQIANKAKAEAWQSLKEAQCNAVAIRVQQRTADAIVNKEVDRIGRMNTLADQLISKLEKATEQLDQLVVANRTKAKTVMYGKDGRPASEVVTEQVQPVVKDICGMIDRRGLKQLTAALKDLHSITSSAEDKDSSGSMEELIGGLRDGGV